MDQVSNILGNILSIEEGSPEVIDTRPKTIKRKSLELDFSTFWNSDKKTEEDSEENEDDSNMSVASVPPANSGSSSSQYMADKLMEKALAMIIPTEIHDYQTTKIIEDRIAIQKQRPGLSFNIMQKNSNMLHQRNSSNYVMINSIIQFFNWDDTYFTIGVLLIITHIILKPLLLTVAPLVFVLANVIIPHYLLVYPPDATQKYLDVNPVPANLPLGKYKIAKPVPLFSREFFLNLTDTQNFMRYYIDSYDFIVWITRDYLYFKDEQVSSLVLLLMLGTIIMNFYTVPILFEFALNHVRFVKISMILSIWLFVIMLHPNNRGSLLEWLYNEDTRLNFQNYVNKVEAKLIGLLEENEPGSEDDSIYVEIFELQKLDLGTKIWEFIGFTPNFYTANTSTRQYNSSISKDEDNTPEGPKYLRIPRKDTLNEILPPKTYEFVGSWTIDYNVTSWVEQNLIKDLVIIDDDEKWAYDYTEDDEITTDVFRRRRWIRKVTRSKTA
ncbi:uncharacterized protein SPAPADRAFT_61128 [Spathaspora passalidarum NRRL Y-27907]|uniref:TECPR1-like DysF domain-containing protein n=1 Tax=Spathaspora passalidarum (strain NRRL Y-27907 / 11-Y1) TaxID=619300 RepID=G3ANU4_SPAPN|nr:uncharacterized protein SPAPADRAFT_61128 [Spathaspora passalidarum NRRL Y-27907]EGW32028.1 hypothetical protein SPAPADRAFT_61128 [Spathaspora passalidarum NRRL Y-27907]